MTPYEFLEQQSSNVERALAETLRYDYGPEPSRPYYVECWERLNRVKAEIPNIARDDFSTIEDRLDELSSLSVWISLIERSRLGEFSWPFAFALRETAEKLLTEDTLSGAPSPPIVHIVADGEGYLIDYEAESASGNQRFAFIAFPRPLRHHVLLHTLFGHELGHTALHALRIGPSLQSKVIAPLEKDGQLASSVDVTTWLNDPSAPVEVKNELGLFHTKTGQLYSFLDYDRLQWLSELFCDLFGLLLFGPAFAAAHRVFLQPAHSNPYQIGLADPTHPPYAVRHKLLVRAMKLLGWDHPVTGESDGDLNKAEYDLLAYVMADPYVPWAALFDDMQISDAIRGIREIFAGIGPLGFEPPNPSDLSNLIRCLSNNLPPLLCTVDEEGFPKLHRVEIAQTLYAGWAYWLGRKRLGGQLGFLETNRLCDQAILQQRAIDIALDKGME